AILKLDEASGKLPTLPLAEKLPRKGDKVAAFGSPIGLSFSASEGIVSAIRTGTELNTMLPGFGRDREEHATWVQTTASISPGNSGGPLIDMQGQIVGLNTLIVSGGNNLNFAISVNDVRALLK